MKEASLRRLATNRRNTLGALAVSALLLGCAEEDTSNDGGASFGGGGATPAGAGGAGAAGGSGGGLINVGGAGGGDVCVATNKKATATPLDIIFLLDWSHSMHGESWAKTTSALQSFYEDPASEGISAGLVFNPTIKPYGDGGVCDLMHYEVLDVPIAPLPDNTFALVNAMPADALGSSSPYYAALRGTLMAATAYQDSHPKHKVIVVMTGDGGYNTCGPGIDEIASWAKAARDYNGVRTFVIAVQSTSSAYDNLQVIADQGGTDVVYDAQDIDQFSAQIADIRAAALGCDFEIPDPPVGEGLVPDEVNFAYTPGGSNTPITLPKADDLADCGDAPGWYYDDNDHPTKIFVCPASCATIQNDTEAEIDVAFGCASVVN